MRGQITDSWRLRATTVEGCHSSGFRGASLLGEVALTEGS